MHRTIRLSVFASLCFAGAAMAQAIAPGLWSIQNKMGGNPEMDKAMVEMQKQLAAMPPAQRKQMEAMMGQSGMSIGAGGAISVKVCITPEMAAKAELPSQTEGDCSTSVTSRSANTLKMQFSCKNPVTTGEGVYTFSGDKAYTAKVAMKTVRQGKTESMTMNGQGQWLSADCGTVKPIQMPTK